MMDQEQSADKKQQNDDQAAQTSGLPISCSIFRVFTGPMVMSIHSSLHRDGLFMVHWGAKWKQDNGWSWLVCFDRHVTNGACD